MERFLFLMHYIREHSFSYGFGILFIFLTNLIAVSIPKYLQLSIDLLSGNIQNSQETLHDYFPPCRGDVSRTNAIANLFF